MRLIVLNLWGGHLYEPLFTFLAEQAKTTDIFCFQEVFNAPDEVTSNPGWRFDLYNRLTEALGDQFIGHFSQAQHGFSFEGVVDDRVLFGEATFVRRGIEVVAQGEIPIHAQINGWTGQDHESFPRIMEYSVLQVEDKELYVGNIHGHHRPVEKIDSEERIAQSKRIRAAMDTHQGPKIICGDFNLNPDTQSIAIVAEGMRDLIKDYGITSTRNHHTQLADRHSDYIFTSPEITLNDFQVLADEVSDHLALMLDFN